MLATWLCHMRRPVSTIYRWSWDNMARRTSFCGSYLWPENVGNLCLCAASSCPQCSSQQWETQAWFWPCTAVDNKQSLCVVYGQKFPTISAGGGQMFPPGKKFHHDFCRGGQMFPHHFNVPLLLPAAYLMYWLMSFVPDKYRKLEIVTYTQVGKFLSLR